MGIAAPSLAVRPVFVHQPQEKLASKEGSVSDPEISRRLALFENAVSRFERHTQDRERRVESRREKVKSLKAHEELTRGCALVPKLAEAEVTTLSIVPSAISRIEKPVGEF